jgi:hypothetical protein
MCICSDADLTVPDAIYAVWAVDFVLVVRVGEKTFLNRMCYGKVNILCSLIQGDQKFSVHRMITVQSSGAQRRFDHSVYTVTKKHLLGMETFSDSKIDSWCIRYCGKTFSFCV